MPQDDTQPAPKLYPSTAAPLERDETVEPDVLEPADLPDHLHRKD